MTYSATASAFAPVAGMTSMPARFARQHIDVVEPDAEASHDLQPRRRREKLAIDLRLVAHDERVGLGDQALERLAALGHLGIEGGVEPARRARRPPPDP